MANNNGGLLLQALQTFDEPATCNAIVNYIAEKAGVSKQKYRSLAYLFLRVH